MGYDYIEVLTFNTRTMLVKAFKFTQSILENIQLIDTTSPLGRSLFTLSGEVSDFVVCEIIDRFRVEQGRQLFDKALFDGENADVIDELLQSNL
jgi:hypothetical protein